MIAVVIGLNLSIASLCLFVAWRLWQLHRPLRELSQRLYQGLQQARQAHRQDIPDQILRSQRGTATLRRQHAALRQQLRLLGQIIAVLGLLRKNFGGSILGRNRRQRRH